MNAWGEVHAGDLEIGRCAGGKADLALGEVVDLSSQAVHLWGEILDMGKNVPSPLTFFDGTIHMGPAVVLRGTHQAVDYYELLLKELEGRILSAEERVGERERELFAAIIDAVVERAARILVQDLGAGRVEPEIAGGKARHLGVDLGNGHGAGAARDKRSAEADATPRTRGE